MKKIQAIGIISSILLLLILPSVAAVDTFDTSTHTISIKNAQAGLLVNEQISLKNNGYQPCNEIKFWVMQNAQNIQITASGRNQPLEYAISGNDYTCNLTQYNLAVETENTTSMTVTYTLPAATEFFDKTLLYPTATLSIIFNDKELFSGQQLASNSTYHHRLYLPTGTPLDILTIVVIIIVVVLLMAITLLLLKKQRRKRKTSITESEELLTIKKTNLLSALKEIEKQHRAKTLSDDTYTKLKDEYKQQAVDVMKKLEDLKK